MNLVHIQGPGLTTFGPSPRVISLSFTPAAGNHLLVFGSESAAVTGMTLEGLSSSATSGNCRAWAIPTDGVTGNVLDLVWTGGTTGISLRFVVYEVEGPIPSYKKFVNITANTVATPSDAPPHAGMFGGFFSGSTTVTGAVGTGVVSGPLASTLDSYIYSTDLGASAASQTVGRTTTGGSFYAGGMFVEASDTDPALTNVGTLDIAAAATDVTFAGVHLGATSAARSVAFVQGAVSVAQTQLSGNDTAGSTSGVAGLGLAEHLKHGTTKIKVTVGAAVAERDFLLNAASGHTFTNLTSINTDDVRRITALPDLVIGQQLESRNVLPSGTVALNDDGTYDTNGESFEVRRWKDATDGWSDWATQTVAPPANSCRARMTGFGQSGVYIY